MIWESKGFLLELNISLHRNIGENRFVIDNSAFFLLEIYIVLDRDDITVNSL